MQIYWAGGEDTDFPLIGSATVQTIKRTPWARTSIQQPTGGNGLCKSTPFPGGPLTTAWLSFQMLVNGSETNHMFVGLAAPLSAKCLGISASSVGTRLSLAKYDGTTRTELLAEGGNSIASGVMTRYDMQVINYGASATVNIYVNLMLVLTYTGDVTVAGMSNFDSIVFFPEVLNNGGNFWNISEIVVADSDTRSIIGLQTLALTGQGTTNNWSNNTYTNINGTAYSDASPVTSNVVGQDQQFNITDPTGAIVYTVLGCVISARMAKGAGSTPNQIKLGYNSGGTVAFGTGAAKTPGPGYNTLYQIDTVNPITGIAFQQSEMNALQLELQSA
jgi:hypothetical protein